MNITNMRPMEQFEHAAELQFQFKELRNLPQFNTHMRSKTMMNLMQVSNSGKPKKTILVKVSSNEALNSNKSEMATR